MRYILIAIITIIASIGSSQDTRSIVLSKDEGPSICECVNEAKDDPQLKSQCDQKYDYNTMSGGERYRMRLRIERCSDPYPCDCIEYPNDKYIQEACTSKFDTTAMDSTELAEYKEDIEGCIVYEETVEITDVCECVNGDPNDEELQERCREVYDVSKMTEEERNQFVTMINECVENKDNPEFLLTICDCMSADEEDLELLENCTKKFPITTMTAQERADIYQQAQDCFSLKTISVEEYCDCFTGKDTGAKCEKLLARMEAEFENAPEHEQEEFVNRLMDCFQR